MEIAATANPPVCRLMDYGKFKYIEQKRRRSQGQSRRSSKSRKSKFRPGTDDGDYNIKLRNIRRFWRWRQCKITLRFRGREITHQELGLALLNRPRRSGRHYSVEQFPALKAVR